ncbi:hypothetical protein BC830DRAFT_628184 [Chytriomyces sp. MP71]|nr:hypothetical protein BC830DRAFT_628184 [Chytriomyces sp. MP71]
MGQFDCLVSFAFPPLFMKSLKKLGTSPQESAGSRSNFLSAIGSRRRVREGSPTAAEKEACGTGFHIIADQTGNRSYVKGMWDFCQDGGEEPLKKLVSSRQAVIKILATINSNLDLYGNTCLHAAVAHEDALLVSVLLVRGADPNKLNRSGMSATLSALRLYGRSSRIVKILNKHGGKLSQFDLEASQKMGPLALLRNDAPLVSRPVAKLAPLLLAVGRDKGIMPAQVVPTDPDRLSRITPRLPLGAHSAAYLHLSSPQLSGSKFVTLKNRSGITPLMKAAYKGHLALIQEQLKLAMQGLKVQNCLGSNPGLKFLRRAHSYWRPNAGWCMWFSI